MAGRQLMAAWGALDGLIINAGSADYLTGDAASSAWFEQLAASNQVATRHCLAVAQPLLARGQRPHVMGILSRYSALQLGHPTQPARGHNSLAHWLREQRPILSQLGIGLTVVAPQALDGASPLATPEDWTPETASAELLARLEHPEDELVLEVLDPAKLWPASAASGN